MSHFTPNSRCFPNYRCIVSFPLGHVDAVFRTLYFGEVASYKKWCWKWIAKWTFSYVYQGIKLPLLSSHCRDTFPLIHESYKNFTRNCPFSMFISCSIVSGVLLLLLLVMDEFDKINSLLSAVPAA